MARIAIVFGWLLCALSALGMAATTTKNPIQFIPLMLGIPILFLGVVGLNPHRRRVTMLLAGGVALVGSISGSIRTLMWTSRWMNEQSINPYAWKMVAAMTAICTTFAVIILIRSWCEARRRQDPFRTGVASIDAEHLVELPDRNSRSADSSAGLVDPTSVGSSSDHR